MKLFSSKRKAGEVDKPAAEKLPSHVAIIMDGNGRWAQKRGMPRVAGHKQGIESAKKVTRHAGKIGIKYLTLFGFSTENWKRPEDEVSELMKFLRYFLKVELSELHENNVCVRMVGFRHRLEKDIVQLIENAEELTANNTGLQLSIALDYGGQQDIMEAMRAMIKDGVNPDDINEELVHKYLMTSAIPHPDFLIRTSGELRISNFLLWQSAYAEYYFTDTFWPDFDEKAFNQALACYSARDRRMGAIAVCDSQKEKAL